MSPNLFSALCPRWLVPNLHSVYVIHILHEYPWKHIPRTNVHTSTPANPCCVVTDQIEGYALKTGLFLGVLGVRISLYHIFGSRVSRGEGKGHRYLLKHLKFTVVIESSVFVSTSIYLEVLWAVSSFTVTTIQLVWWRWTIAEQLETIASCQCHQSQ